MNLSFVSSLLLLVTIAGASALDIQFSTEEGYPAETSPLNGTPKGAPVWRTSPEDGFLVNGTQKFVTTSPASASGTALLTSPIAIAMDQTVTISVDFECSGVSLEDDIPEGGIHLPNIAIGTSNQAFYQGALSVLFGHFSWANGDYTLQFNPGNQFSTFNAGDIGVDGPDDPSDRLRFILRITKNAEPQGWDCEVTLLNVTTNLSVACVSAQVANLPKEFRTSRALFLNLNRGSSPAEKGPSTVKFFAVSVKQS